MGDGWPFLSVVRVAPPIRPRKLAKVPFVELADGRLQGVVSQRFGHRARLRLVDRGRVRTRSLQHQQQPAVRRAWRLALQAPEALVDEAVLQYGVERVARYLRVESAGERDGLVAAPTAGSISRTPAAPVFSRFLRHLAYLELPATTRAAARAALVSRDRGGRDAAGAAAAQLADVRPASPTPSTWSTVWTPPWSTA